jgi:hypothetical protein
MTKDVIPCTGSMQPDLEIRLRDAICISPIIFWLPTGQIRWEECGFNGLLSWISTHLLWSWLVSFLFSLHRRSWNHGTASNSRTGGKSDHRKVSRLSHAGTVQLQSLQHIVDLIKDEKYLFDRNNPDSSIDEDEPRDFEIWNRGHIFASTRSNWNWTWTWTQSPRFSLIVDSIQNLAFRRRISVQTLYLLYTLRIILL